MIMMVTSETKSGFEHGKGAAKQALVAECTTLKLQT
jgi:hypothetical protein